MDRGMLQTGFKPSNWVEANITNTRLSDMDI